jgi:putative hydrolase of the HAD superfamily
MNSIRAVFLDAGGTLIHLDAPLILGALAEQGLERDAEDFRRADVAARQLVSLRLRSGEPIDDRTRWHIWAGALLAGLGCDERAAAAVSTTVRAHAAAGRLWSRTADGTTAMLGELRAAGLAVGVVSNSDGRVESLLAAAGLRPLLDFVIDSGSVGVEKPDPRIFALACARAGVSPQHALHVGDVYEVDVLGARAAGVTPVLFDPDDLVPDADCARIRDLAALPALLLTPRAA